MTSDSGSRRDGENSRSEVEGEARQSGGDSRIAQNLSEVSPMTIIGEEMTLLPCPFCGPRSEESGEWPQLFKCESDCLVEWSIRCGCCGIEKGGEYREEVIAEWNTRSPEAVTVSEDVREAGERFKGVLDSLAHKRDDVTVYIGPHKAISLGDLRAIYETVAALLKVTR